MGKTHYVKGMCCTSCVKALKEELSHLPLRVISVRIGEAELDYDEETVSPGQIQTAIEDAGFEIMTLVKDRKIQEVKQYVKEHIADSEALHLSHLSRAMAVSPFHLSRTFSLSEGEGIKDFIIRTRMELAAKLLAESDQSVLDICMSLGLNSPSHFTKEFKKRFGRTPLAYRKSPEAKPGILYRLGTGSAAAVARFQGALETGIFHSHGRHLPLKKR